MKRNYVHSIAGIGLLILALTLISANDHHEPDFHAVQSELESIVNGFNGDVGIYVKHLRTGKTIEINADTIFPSASMVKVPIMTKIFEKMAAGELHYDSTHVYEDRLYYAGEDVVASFKSGEKISLHKLLFLMISFSDNTASLWLQELAGSGSEVNDLMHRLGLEHTRVNSRTAGRQNEQRVYGWGQTTPREMAMLVESIYNGEIVSEEASEEMYRLMSKSLWDKEALSSIPKNIQAASKQGAVNRSRSEVVLVNAPGNDYLFTVITKNQQDTSWGDDNEGFVLLRTVSSILWEHIGESGH
jgi:beta-lactamase class A